MMILNMIKVKAIPFAGPSQQHPIQKTLSVENIVNECQRMHRSFVLLEVSYDNGISIG